MLLPLPLKLLLLMVVDKLVDMYLLPMLLVARLFFYGSGRRHSAADLLNSENPVNIQVAVYASVERVLLASTLQSSRSRLSDGWFTGVRWEGITTLWCGKIGLLVSVPSLELTASYIAFSLLENKSLYSRDKATSSSPRWNSL